MWRASPIERTLQEQSETKLHFTGDETDENADDRVLTVSEVFFLDIFVYFDSLFYSKVLGEVS